MHSDPLPAPCRNGIVTHRVTRPQASHLRVSPCGFAPNEPAGGMGPGGWLTRPLYQSNRTGGAGLTAL
jgi:hypothetical protein